MAGRPPLGAIGRGSPKVLLWGQGLHMVTYGYIWLHMGRLSYGDPKPHMFFSWGGLGQ